MAPLSSPSSKAESRRLRREQYFKERDDRRAEYADDDEHSDSESARMFSASAINVADINVTTATGADDCVAGPSSSPNTTDNDTENDNEADADVSKAEARRRRREQYFKERDERRAAYADEDSESARMFSATGDVDGGSSLAVVNDADETSSTQQGDAATSATGDCTNDDGDDGDLGESENNSLGSSQSLQTSVDAPVRVTVSVRVTSGNGKASNDDEQSDRGSAILPVFSRKESVARAARQKLTLTISSMPSELKLSATRVKAQDWLQTFYHLDPRWQILRFFNDVAREGVNGLEGQGKISTQRLLQCPIKERTVRKVGVFSVWRPTSNDAIRKMMTGEGAGKGLDIKGKSAQRGKFSGFVPYLQISKNEDKSKVCVRSSDGRVRVFYPSEEYRDRATIVLAVLKDKTIKKTREANEIIRETVEKEKEVMQDEVEIFRTESARGKFSTEPLLEDAKKIIQDSRRRLAMGLVDYKKFEKAVSVSLRLDMADPSTYRVDDYVSTQGVYGLDIPEKLFWEAYVEPFDITLDKGGEYDSGRPSMPEFQEMNIRTLRKKKEARPRWEQVTDPDPLPVLWHGGCGAIGEDPSEDCDPMDPRGLLMAYEEDKSVTPVVSDFDCSLFGTRGVPYLKPFREEEMSMLTSCIDKIEGILSTPEENKSWTQRWLDMKKKGLDAKDSGEMPKYGYADPRSYAIIQGAVHRLRKNGAVRHGPECFNFSFPQAQDKDDLFLVISDTLPGKVPWKYVNADELIDILCEKVDEGFTFPLNPKWILADPGWKRIYDKLLASDLPHVQDSMNTWYPPQIRKRIAEISVKHPLGFVDSCKESPCYQRNSQMEMDIAELQLKRYNSYKHAVSKLRRAISTKSAMKAKGGTFFSAALQLMKNAKEEGEKLRASWRRSTMERSKFNPDLLARSSELDDGLNGSVGTKYYPRRVSAIFNSEKLTNCRTLLGNYESSDDSEEDLSELERLFNEDDSSHSEELNDNTMDDSNSTKSIDRDASSSKRSIIDDSSGMRSIASIATSSKSCILKFDRSASNISLSEFGDSEHHSERRVSVFNDSCQSIASRVNLLKNPDRQVSFSSKHSFERRLQSCEILTDKCPDEESLHRSDATNASRSSKAKSLRKSLKKIARKLSIT